MSVALYFLSFAIVDFKAQGEPCSSNTEEKPFHHSTVLLLY